MVKLMKDKYDKYWSKVNNVNVLMFITLLLDPKLKDKNVFVII